MRDVRRKVDGLPENFCFHDLRHYLASLLIASGADIKTVQARMRHAAARTTLDTYGHLWPDADESTRSAIGAVITERMDSVESTAYPLRTESAFTSRRRRSEGYDLHVVVQRDLVRVRTDLHRDDLVLPLVGDPGLDQVLGEHAALGEVFVILLEAVDDRRQ